jgi:hypothetical protein
LCFKEVAEVTEEELFLPRCFAFPDDFVDVWTIYWYYEWNCDAYCPSALIGMPCDVFIPGPPSP